MTKPRRKSPGPIYAQRLLFDSVEESWRQKALMNHRMLEIQGEAANTATEILRSNAKAADAAGHYTRAMCVYLDFLSALYK